MDIEDIKDLFDDPLTLTRQELSDRIHKAVTEERKPLLAEIDALNSAINILKRHQPTIKLEVKQKGWLRQLLGF